MNLTLDQNCYFINGGSWTEADYRSEGVPVLKVSNFNSSGFSINDISFLDINQENKYLRNKLEINDIVIATVGSHPSLVNSAAGRTIRINKVVENFYLNQNAICLRTSDPNIIDQRFLYLLTETVVFKNFIQQRGKGAANQMRIPISGIKEFTYDFPPIQTQRKIASILSGYDDLIENNLKRIKILEEMAQHYFKNFLAEIKTEKSVYLNDIIDFHIGGGWGEEVFSDEFSNDAFVIRGTDIDPMRNGSISNVPLRFHKASNLKTRKLIAGDIVFEVSGGSTYEGVAKTALITKELLASFVKDVMCASFCKLLRVKETKHSYYLFLFLQYLRERKTTEIYEKRSASNIVNYNWEAFLKYQKVILPDEKKLDQFNSLVENLFKIIHNLGNQNQRLRESRDILLPRLMMGMIEVDGLEVNQELGMVAESGINYNKI